MLKMVSQDSDSDNGLHYDDGFNDASRYQEHSACMVLTFWLFVLYPRSSISPVGKRVAVVIGGVHVLIHIFRERGRSGGMSGGLGGSGGGGETELQLQRRRIRTRIKVLKRQLAEVTPLQLFFRAYCPCCVCGRMHCDL